MKPVLYNESYTNVIGVLNNCIDCYTEEERNGTYSLTLSYPVTDPLHSELIYGRVIQCKSNDEQEGQYFRIYNTERIISGLVHVSALHISFDLAYDYVDNVNITNQSCEYVLNTLFRQSQFSTHYKGYSDIVNAQNYAIQNVNIVDAIVGAEGSIVDTFGKGAEIKRDNTNIYVFNKRGHNNGVKIEYGVNLLDESLQVDTSELVTSIIGTCTSMDVDGVEHTITSQRVDSPNIGNYPHPYILYKDYSERFEVNEVPTMDRLLSFIQEDYTVNEVDQPNCSYTIDFVPLSRCSGYEDIEDKIHLCDTVRIIDSRFGIDTEAKVIKYKYNVLTERYETMELGDPRNTLSDIITNSTQGQKGEKGEKGDKGDPGADGNIGDFPQSLPGTPTLSGLCYGFGSIELSWTFESQVYYSYELYASRTQGFNPTLFDLIQEGQISSYLFQAKPNETWYFKVCGKNTYGERTAFSNELKIETYKIDDMTNYFTDMAIGQAVVGSLTADYMSAGILKGHWIDAKNLSVTNGNGIRTLDIDSNGDVYLNVNSLSINSNDVATQSYADTKATTAQNNAVAQAKTYSDSILNQANANTTSLINNANKYAEQKASEAQQMAEQLANAYADEVGTTTLNSAKTYANTQASNAQANAIAQANQNTANSLMNYYTKKETDANITLINNEINLKASKTEVTQAIDNILVGSTNLFRWSNFARPKVLDYWGISNSAFHTEGIYTYDRSAVGRQLDIDKHIGNQKIYRSRIDIAKAKAANTVYASFYPYSNGSRYYMQLEANTTYTFSFWCYRSGNASSCLATIYYKNEEGTNTKLTQTEALTTYTGAFQKCSVTFTTNSFNEIHIVFYHYYDTTLTEGSSDMHIYNPLVTKGNKELDWSENPTDIEDYGIDYTQTQVTQAQAEIKLTTDAITQNVNNLSLTVDKKADSSTVTSLSNRVATNETSINGINQSVSSLTTKVNTKADSSTVTTLSNRVGSIETNVNSITSRVSSVESEVQEANENALKNYNNLLINSNIKNGLEGWRLNNLVLNTSIFQSTTTATAPPDRHTIIIGTNTVNTAQLRYMDSSKFVVQAGEKISISYYVMGNEYLDYCRVYILFTDNTKPIEEDNTFFEGYTYTGISGYTAWTKKTETVTVPTGATRAFVRIRYQSKEKPSTDDLARAALASIMVSRGDDYPSWSPSAEDAYYYHEGRLKTAEQKITDDAIISTVSSTYYKKTEVDNQVKNINNSIDNIQVGGENLISFTDFSTNKYLNKWCAYYNSNGEGTLVHVIEPSYDVGCFRVYSSTQSVADVPPGIFHNEYIKLIGGQEYTLSFSAKSGGFTGTLDYIYILNYDEGGSNQKLSSVTIHANDSDLDKVTSSITFKPNVNIEKARILIGCQDAVVSSNNKGFYIKNIKLEKGNKATDWCPSPKDAEYELQQTNNNLSSLTTRVSTAESKITDTAITNVVKQNFYTKQETENSITSKGYQTASQVQQTVDKLELKFQESGGYNLLYNGDFRRQGTNWILPSGFTINYGNGNYSSPDRRGVRIQGQSGVAAYLSQDISSEHFNHLNFTLSGYIYIHGEGVDDAGQSIFAHYYVRLGYSDGSYTYHRATWDRTIYNKWQYVTISFSRDTTKTLTGIRVTLAVQYTTRAVYLSQAMLEPGTMATGWSPNPNETHDGIVTIDKDGMNITSTNSNTQTQVTADGFYINNANTNVLKVDGNGLVLDQGNVSITKNGLVLQSPTGGLQTQTSNNGFYITQNGTNIFYANTNGVSLANGNVTMNANGISVQSPSVSTTTFMNANGFNIKNGDEYVFTVDSSGIKLAQGQVIIDKDKVKVAHSDGSYSQMTASGFMRYVSGSNRYYHYLISTGTVNVRDGQDATVQLSDEFKGKNFYVTVSAFKVNIISGWKGIYDIDALVRSYDRANGRFTVGGMVNDVNGLEGTLDVSYIVIA